MWYHGVAGGLFGLGDFPGEGPMLAREALRGVFPTCPGIIPLIYLKRAFLSDIRQKSHLCRIYNINYQGIVYTAHMRHVT